MNVHEYQAKQILQKYGVECLPGNVAQTNEDARRSAESLGGDVWVVKAQVHAGGRGKAGGVKLAKSLEEVQEHASNILGMTLVSPQTGPQGKLVKKIYIEKGCEIEKEFYVGLVIDRAIGKTVMMASSEGGMEIEEVAKNNPEKIHKEVIEPGLGLQAFQARKLAFAIGIQPKLVGKATKFFMGLSKAFHDCDCSVAEINPLVETKDGRVLALDAKMNFDSNALYRHQDILEMRDLDEEDPMEVEASKAGMSFIKLDGTIGCLVNGAGLAMATMDIIKLHGEEPANFLDVGGGASKDTVTKAFKILLNDQNVKTILVNIFGGIMKCDIIAEGVIAATKELGLNVPLVVRLAGTNVERGQQLLKDSGLNIISANDLTDAAQKAVSAVRGE
jgi:succinyl-CoA synthetase beta subunit